MDVDDNGWIMLMTPHEWITMDVMTLHLNHVSITTAMSNTPEPSIKATTITLSKMETTNFLKYVSVVLTDKSQFLIFYDNLVTHAAGFNIFLRPSNKIARIKGVIPD